jgi:hypothetical protein
MDIINPTMGASPRPLVTAAPVEKMTGTYGKPLGPHQRWNPDFL